MVINEAGSVAIEAFVLALPSEELVTSAWTKVELASLVARRERMGDLSGTQGSKVRAGDTLHLAVARNNGALEVLSLDQGLIKAARQLGLTASTGIRLRR